MSTDAALQPDEHQGRIRRTISYLRRLAVAIEHGTEADVDRVILELAGKRRYLAPLALGVGAFVMLFQGVRLLITNWRLTLVQVLPAMWIWAAMLDLKAHALHGKEFRYLRGPVLGIAVLLVVLITVAAYVLNAVFAFAIANPGKPDIPRGFREARAHLRVIAAWGSVIGLGLAFASLRSDHFGKFAFVLSMSIMVGIMMLTYVALPSRLLGVERTAPRRDQLAATAIAGAVGAAVASPAYLIGRVGILMLGSKTLFWLGVVMLSIGLVLQAGLSGATRAIKLSAKLVANPKPADQPSEG